MLSGTHPRMTDNSHTIDTMKNKAFVSSSNMLKYVGNNTKNIFCVYLCGTHIQPSAFPGALHYIIPGHLFVHSNSLGA